MLGITWAWVFVMPSRITAGLVAAGWYIPVGFLIGAVSSVTWKWWKTCISPWTFALGQSRYTHYVWRVSWCNGIWHFLKSVKIWMLNLEFIFGAFLLMGQNWLNELLLLANDPTTDRRFSLSCILSLSHRERNSMYDLSHVGDSGCAYEDTQWVLGLVR